MIRLQMQKDSQEVEIPVEKISSFGPKEQNHDEKQNDIGDEGQEIVTGSLEQVPQRRSRNQHRNSSTPVLPEQHIGNCRKRKSKQKPITAKIDEDEDETDDIIANYWYPEANISTNRRKWNWKSKRRSVESKMFR